MGRIKTQFVKRITEELIQKHSDKFTENFEDNKKKVDELADVPSKKLRNVIAGYVTRRMKNKDELDDFTMN